MRHLCGNKFAIQGFRRVSLLVLGVFATLVSAYAQRNQPLGKDASDFQEAFSAYMVSDPNQTKDEREILTAWAPLYLSYFSGMNPQRQEDVAEIVRLAHKSHIKIYPDLYNFFRTQQNMEEEHEKAHDVWIEALRGLLKKNRSHRFNLLVSATYNLSVYKRIYKSTGAEWKVSEADFGFGFEGKDEPVFTFTAVDVVCTDNQDSLVIENTRGTFYPFDDRFDGRGGKAFWERVRLSPDSCYTELDTYKINLKQSRYQASNVTHHNLYLYPQPLKGNFSDRIITGNPLIKERYPQFVSRDVLYFSDMFKEVDVEGTLVQEGIRSSFGSEGKSVHMQIREGDNVRVNVYSDRLLAERGKVSAASARIVMYLDADSLYNTSVTVRYDAGTRVLYVSEPQGTGLRVPFIDTYHGLRMEFEAMRWYLNRKEVEIGLLEIPGRVGSVSFKSLNIFSREELGKISLGAEENPLYLLSVLAKEMNDRTLFLSEVSDKINMSSTQALAMLNPLIAYGYVAYNPESGKVRLLPQLFHTLEVTAGKADFDEIEFKTTEQGIVKAVMRLDSLDIVMRGVPYVLLSGKQNVYARPLDSVVHIFKNTDFYFNGLFHAGKFNYTARGARFYYDEFKVDIADVQEMGLEVTRVIDGELKKHPVESVIKSLTGTVYIDAPDNKGGRKDYPEYPIFESTQPSYVYYDQTYIQGGAYTADSFYFRVDPFRMEKLHTVEMDSIRFNGTLLSHGIFPDIREYLVVRPDNSLGFGTQSPPGGWQTYRGQSVYEGNLYLDKGGLYGKGEFRFLSALAESSRMVFLPKRMYGRSKDIYMPDTLINGRGLPQMRASGIEMDYSRNRNELVLKSVRDSVMRFYRENWLLSGTYRLSQKVSEGAGVLSNQGRFKISSRNFSLDRREFSADTASFEILDPERSLLAAGNLAAKVDLDAGQGEFQSHDFHSPIHFGANHYDGYVSHLSWDMERETVFMQHGETPSSSLLAELDSLPKGELFTCDLPGENFKSDRRAQAGLNFNATSSYFSYEDMVLHFDGVRRILTADVMFVPAEEKTVIGSNGQMLPLEGAELYFGDPVRPHSFHNVSAQIYSGEQYRASGMFDYKAPGMEVQPIYFNGIRPLSTGYSEASTKITYDSGVLALNEAFQFIGKIELSAKETYPFFAGSVRMNYACRVSEDNPREENEEPEPVWDEPYNEEFLSDEETEELKMEREADDAMAEEDEERPSGRRGKRKGEDEARPAEEVVGLSGDNPFLTDGIQFRAYINSDSVSIPIDAETRSTIGRLLGCGFYTQMRSRQVQFRFMERTISTDAPNLAVVGNLQFSAPDKAYRIVDSTGEEVFTLSLNSCTAAAYGPINPVFNTYELGMKFYGEMMRSGYSGKISTDAMGIFDFYLSEDIQKRLATLFNTHVQSISSNRDVNGNVEAYLESVLSPKEFAKVMADARFLGVLNRIPDVLRQSLVFSDFELVWDADRKAFFSPPGAVAEVLSVGGNPVNKRYKAMVCLRKTRKGDVVDIYLEANSSLWFYFSYNTHYMQIVTSNEIFNQYLESLKARARKKGRYEFYLATLSKKTTFVNWFLSNTESE